MHKDEIIDKLYQIIEAINIIQERCQNITCANDFLTTPWGMTVFDSCIMRLQVIDETIKTIDDKTEQKLFNQYPEMPWRKIIGLRNIISHEYANVDSGMIWITITKHLSPLKKAVIQIIENLNS